MNTKPRNTLDVARFCMAAFSLLCSGCLMPTYRYGRFKESAKPSEEATQNIVTYDEKHKQLDRIEALIFAPLERLSSLFGPDGDDLRSRDERMNESLETTLAYLTKNDLHDVFVDVRRYNPRLQWARLRQNKRMHPVWKYSAGVAAWTVETIIPARVFRYTYYNPFTNTLAVNSVWKEWNIYEAARAKDYLGAHFPGAYATAQHIPFVPIYQEIRVGSDAITYARFEQDPDLERSLYPFAYGEVFGATVEEAAFLVPGLSGLPLFTSPLIWGSSFTAGYGIGSAKANMRKASSK